MIARYAYNDNGNRISLEYPESGLTTAYTYNSANLVTSLVNRRGDTVVSSYRYTYYLDGNQKSKTGADGKVTDYVYDGMGRLARESEAEGNTISYAYDRFSNRSSMTVTGGETYTTTYGYHPNNWLLTEKKREKDTMETYRYRYDGNGNQVYREWSRTGPDDGTVPRVGYVPNGFRRELATLEIRGYNGFNQMASLYADGERTAYTYRPDGLRYGKTYGSGAGATGVTHLWDGQNIVAEVGATGNVVARYLRGANLIAREQDGAAQYYLFNAHGDVAQRTDALGNLLKNYRYDAFGNEEHPEPLDVNPFRYCGEYFDRETGDYYLRARSYDPRTGRMLSEDPVSTRNMNIFDPKGDYQRIELKGGVFKGEEKNQFIVEDVRSLNRYNYGAANPNLYMDTSGKIFMLVTAAIGAVVGGIAGAIYSYAKYGEVRWQNVLTGVAVGGVIGLGGGAAVAYIAAGSATASTGAVMTGLGIAEVTVAGGSGALAADQASRTISNVIPNTANHIMQTKHAWDLVGANDWSAVSNVINTALTKGTGVANDVGNVVYSYVYKGQTVEVTTRVVNGVTRIVDAWVRTR